MIPQAGTTYYVGPEAVGSLTQPVRVYAMHVITGSTKATVKLYNGSVGSGTVMISETCEVASTGNTWQYWDDGILFPNGCSILTDVNTVSAIITYALIDGVGTRPEPITNALLGFGGLTFYKPFMSDETKNARYSVGSPTGTFTRDSGGGDGSHPSTYVDSNGLIQVVNTDNTPRFQGGYYDSTGFHAQKGLMMERASTNMLQDSYFASGSTTYWRAQTGATVTNDSTYANLYLGGNTQKIVTDSADEGIITADDKRPSFTNTSKYTVSAIMRGTGNVKLWMAVTGGANQVGSAIALSDSWRLYQYTFTADATGAGYIGAVQTGAGTATFYVSAIQCEALPYATSFIPTTTAELTRNAESLSYLNAGNRTASTESIFVKFASNYTWASNSLNSFLISSDTKNRVIYKLSAGGSVTTSPNVTDTAGCVTTASTTITANTSFVVAGTMSATGNPNLDQYLNGSKDGNTDNDDFTPNAWGNNFYIGAGNAANSQLDGIIQAVAIYNNVKSSEDVRKITALLNTL